MVHLMIVPHVNAEQRSKFFFQTSAGVGKNRPNQREDVAIVQFMLTVVQGIYIPRNNPVKVDGFVGPVTIAAILDFQNWMRDTAKLSIVPDSAVDPTRRSIGAHRVLSTLGNLNLRAAMHVFSWPDIRQEPALISGSVGFLNMLEG